MKKISLIFYISGSIILTLPVILFKIFSINLKIINNIYEILHFNFNSITILFLFFSISILFLYDIFFYKNNNQLKKNIILLEHIFGTKTNIKLNLLLSFLSGYFEELLFRGYLYYLLLNIIIIKDYYNNIYAELIIFFLISLLFALFHVIQGKEIFIISFLISIVFLISIKLSSSIWYAVLTHSIINFIELTFIIPYQRNKIL